MIVVSTAWKMCRSQKSILTQRNGVGTSVRNLKGKHSTVAKMCCLVQRDFAGHCPKYIYNIIIYINYITEIKIILFFCMGVGGKNL